MLKNTIKMIGVLIVLVSTLAANDDKYFVGASTGLSYMDVAKYDRVGSISLAREADDKGMNFNLELGYKYNKNTFSTIGLYHQKYNDVKFYNYLVSYNKRLDYKYNPYIGVVGGISYIELTKGHINSPITDEKGRKFAIGAQVGFEHPLKNNLTLFGQYQYLKAKHTTALVSTPALSEFVRDNYSNISFGVRWAFSIF